jgi:hypothetical protein
VSAEDDNSAKIDAKSGDDRRPKQADVLIELAQSAALFHTAGGPGFADYQRLRAPRNMASPLQNTSGVGWKQALVQLNKSAPRLLAMSRMSPFRRPMRPTSSNGSCGIFHGAFVIIYLGPWAFAVWCLGVVFRE